MKWIYDVKFLRGDIVFYTNVSLCNKYDKNDIFLKLKTLVVLTRNPMMVRFFISPGLSYGIIEG